MTDSPFSSSIPTGGTSEKHETFFPPSWTTQFGAKHLLTKFFNFVPRRLAIVYLRTLNLAYSQLAAANVDPPQEYKTFN